DTNLESPLKETAVTTTTGFESISLMCCQEYKLLCWTQCPLFLRSLDPPNTFKSHIPESGCPTINKIIDNLYYVALDISQSENSSWKSQKGAQLILNSLKETYNHLETLLKTGYYSEIASRIQTNAKIFLNGNDPSNPKDWVSGKNLVFGAQEDVRAGLHKVHDNLKEFKQLLKLAGAREIKNINFDIKTQTYSQKDKLLSGLLDSFEQNDTMHHDVVFQIHHKDEIEEIKANRYVLSAASEHFKALFCGKMKEAIEYQKVIVDIDDIEPSTFRVLIRWLHGQELEEAISTVLNDSKCSDVFLVDLLKASDKYQVDPLKDQVEILIIKGSYVNIDNAIEINEWAKLLRATQLNNYCQQYIKENKTLVIEKKIVSFIKGLFFEISRNFYLFIY
ncbi:10217_t:CDS:2, partial [Dentiscutata erythropus]